MQSRKSINRLVEDLIQESMSRGDFDNIKPSGQILHEHNTHYMDFITYKMNEILINNGKIRFFLLKISLVLIFFSV